MPRLIALSALALSCALCVPAAKAADEVCRNGLFPKQETTFGLAKVIGAPRAYLRSDMAPCPNDTAACKGQTYVVPTDTVITGVTSGTYVCVFYPGKYGGSAGYVRQDEIVLQQKISSLPLTAWKGTWRDGDNRLTLRVEGNRLIADGEAYWPSANPPPKDRPGGPNLGDLSGTATPTGNTVVFGGEKPDDCRVALTLLPPYLLAADNMNCGGMNVSFTGVYRKR